MFANGWAIWIGATAIGLPLLMHWLTRPRPRRLSLSTLRFVRELMQQRRARWRVRDLAILLLRAAAVALLAIAFARPLAGARPASASDDQAPIVRVLVVDQSQSMGAGAGGATAFERARGAAAAQLAARHGLRTGLLLAAARPRPVFDAPTGNPAALLDALSRAAVRPERLDVAAALQSAAAMLARGGAASRRELTIVSDFQRSNWANADVSVLPEDVNIRLESVAPSDVAANLGILRAAASGRAEVGRPTRIEIDVGNYSPAARTAEVAGSIGETAFRAQGFCPPNATTTLTCDVALPGAGWLTGEAALVGVEDALPADDRRSIAVEVRPARLHALLTRQAAGRGPAASFYVERALAPLQSTPGANAERVIRLRAEAPDLETLSRADLVALAEPGLLDAKTIATLAECLRRGKPVIYVAGAASDATNLQRLSDAAGREWSLPVAFAPAGGGRARPAVHLAHVRESSRPFLVFGDQLGAALRPLRFQPGLFSRRLERGLADDILAEYSDGTACLVVTRCGAGCLAVLNADLTRSNLAVSSVFVPMLGDLVSEMLRRQEITPTAVCGEPLAACLPAAAGAAGELRAVGVEAADSRFSDDARGVLWRWDAPAVPRAYCVQRGDRTVFALVCGLAAEESDLRTLPSSAFEARQAAGRRVTCGAADDAANGERTSSWPWFAAACMACMLAEIAVLRIART